MGYGDAYVYLLVTSNEVAEKIKLLIEEIAGKQKLIDEIIAEMDKDGELKPERGKRGLAIMDEQQELRRRIICLCKKPIAIYDVADDSWLDAWHACFNLTYESIKVSDVVKATNGKMWCKEELMEKYPDRMCILLPSHYDTDEDFREMVGVNTVRFEDYNRLQEMSK